MAKIKLQAHSDFNKDIKPLETALEGFTDAVEGYYGYIYGSSRREDERVKAKFDRNRCVVGG